MIRVRANIISTSFQVTASYCERIRRKGLWHILGECVKSITPRAMPVAMNTPMAVSSETRARG